MPLYHIFGSEELSAAAPAVAELAPAPYLALNPADAAAFGLEPKARVPPPVKVAPSCPAASQACRLDWQGRFARWGRI